MVMRIAAVLWVLAFTVGAMPAASGVLSGDVFYRERVALPPNAVLEISLVDVTRPGGLGELVASMQVRTNHQVPIPFEIRYGDDDVDPRRSYAVRANILADGRLLFVNARPQRVLTLGHPNSVRILMAAVMSVASTGDNGIVGQEWVAEDIGGRGVVDNVRTAITIGAGGEVTGSGGCNRLRGVAQTDGSSLTFGSTMATTRMMCPPAVMDQEVKFLRALDLTREFRLDGPYLKFLDRDGAALVRFARAQ